MLFSSYVIVHRWESDQHLKIQRRSISKSLFACWGLADPKWVNWNKNSIFSTYYATRYRLQFLFNMFIFAGFMKYITSFSSLLFADSCRQFLLSNCIQSWKWNSKRWNGVFFSYSPNNTIENASYCISRAVRSNKVGILSKFASFRFGQVYFAFLKIRASTHVQTWSMANSAFSRVIEIYSWSLSKYDIWSVK